MKSVRTFCQLICIGTTLLLFGGCASMGSGQTAREGITVHAEASKTAGFTGLSVREVEEGTLVSGRLHRRISAEAAGKGHAVVTISGPDGAKLIETKANYVPKKWRSRKMTEAFFAEIPYTIPDGSTVQVRHELQ